MYKYFAQILFARILLLVLMAGFIQPNFAFAQADITIPTITSFSTEFISVTSKDSYTTTIAIYGTNLGYLLDDGVDVTLGPLVASSVSGNATGMNITFPIDYRAIPNRHTSYAVQIVAADMVVAESTDKIELFNPYRGKYTRQHTKKFLQNTPHKHAVSKRLVGVNVHWALGGSSDNDDQYAAKLAASNTIWAREHFSYKLIMGDDSAAWLKRYDQTILRYKDQDIKIVGMLAYGSAEAEFTAPSAREWKNFVRRVVLRYRNDVDVWEIWNEPDSADYLSPNTWEQYKPLLKHGSSIIRTYDPDAIILNGAVADITNQAYIRKLYKYGGRYFDELNVHVYYCDEFRDDGESLGRLQADWERLETVVAKYNPDEHIWITELGCSTGDSGITDKLVVRYMKAATKLLLSYKHNRPILLYTFRDRPYLEAYEAYFGLLEDDFSNKPAWNWYKGLKVY